MIASTAHRLDLRRHLGPRDGRPVALVHGNPTWERARTADIAALEEPLAAFAVEDGYELPG